MSSNIKFIVSISGLFILWVITAFIAIFSGSYDISPFDAFSDINELTQTIFFKIRIPRVLMATIAGGTLAMAGAALDSDVRVDVDGRLSEPFWQ